MKLNFDVKDKPRRESVRSLVEQFLESGKDAATLEIDENQNAAEVQSHLCVLRKKFGYPIDIARKDGKLFLMRKPDAAE